MNSPRTGLARPVATFVVLVMALTGALLVGGQSTAGAAVGTAERSTVAKNGNGKLTSTVRGRTADGRKVTGTFTPLRFTKGSGTQQVRGVIDGVITAADGSRERFTVLRTLKVKKIDGRSLRGLDREASRQAPCQVLDLVLGPLDLNLLGLRVQLNQVVLDITAVPGPGNLLGNLLCAVVGLLDGGPLGGLLGQLNTLLDQVLRALNLGV